MQKTIRMAALAALFAAAPLGASIAADRGPDAQETAIIRNVLLSEGFTSWGRIELDDGQWEVENAIDQDGNRRDLVLVSQFFFVDADEDDSLVRLN